MTRTMAQTKLLTELELSVIVEIARTAADGAPSPAWAEKAFLKTLDHLLAERASRAAQEPIQSQPAPPHGITGIDWGKSVRVGRETWLPLVDKGRVVDWVLTDSDPE